MKSYRHWTRFICTSFNRFESNFPQNSRVFSHFSGDFEQESWNSAEGLVRCSANYVPLSPISLLERAAKAGFCLNSVGNFPWRCGCDIGPNVPAMYELHFAVPMAGAVLCTLNARHDSNMVSVLLKHSEAKIIFVDYQLLDVARKAFEHLAKTEAKPPMLVFISESDGFSPIGFNSSTYEYESLLANGHNRFEIRRPKSEWDPISINYTSGTTSRPKGVVYSHRGAYLNSLSTVFLHGIGAMPIYLWTVPMFHCNGWCLIWGVAAQGGTNVCLRKVSPKDIFDSIVHHKVTNMGGAPTVLNMIVNSAVCDQKPLPHKVEVMTGETYGPGTYCAWKPEWDSLPHNERLKLKTRQGVHHLGLEDVDVRDPITEESVPADGKTIGEVVFRGNTVMSGYFKDLEETEKAFRGGWFRSGDLAVKHPDGYIEVKDRLKDIIISGGENISTVEVETVLYSHPAIFEAAVVARPDDHWGQTPCAFVKLKEGFDVSAQDIIKFCRDHLPHYMAPRTVIFEDLPRTSTGKVQKFILRRKQRQWAASLEIKKNNNDL
ncbi:hypothetical protein GH714_034844 [Hevea brasiliensis]|uniref:AMP-dependent synthetase/ligase domain-containing protein n=1 Tax=Hevea brasiliensis TaxID=3981 RepID=A0A6A6MIY7_HEVBR|nr:hypothetical protein GH714_034844 [Hevea brasiliensis]